MTGWLSSFFVLGEGYTEPLSVEGVARVAVTFETDAACIFQSDQLCGSDAGFNANLESADFVQSKGSEQGFVDADHVVSFRLLVCCSLFVVRCSLLMYVV